MVNQKLLEACQNALGAYEVLALTGLSTRLPGYHECLNDLKLAIAEATSVPAHANSTQEPV